MSPYSEQKNFRPRLNRTQVGIILNALIDRQELNPPKAKSQEALILEDLRYTFETMEARSKFMLGRRGRAKTRPGAPKLKGDKR